VDRRRLATYDLGPFYVWANDTESGDPQDAVYLPFSIRDTQRGRKDLLILQIRSNDTDRTPDNSWTQIENQWGLENVNNLGQFSYFSLYWRRWEAGDPESFVIDNFNGPAGDFAHITIIRNVVADGNPFYNASTSDGTGTNLTAPTITTQKAQDMVIDVAMTYGGSDFARTGSELVFVPTDQGIGFLNPRGMYHSFGWAETPKAQGAREISWSGNSTWRRWSAAVKKADPMSAYPMPNYLFNPQPDGWTSFIPPYMKGDIVMTFSTFNTPPSVPGWTFTNAGTLAGSPLYFGVWDVPSNFAELDSAYFTLDFAQGLPVIPVSVKNATKSLQTLGTTIGDSDTPTGTGGSATDTELVVDLLHYVDPTFSAIETDATNATLDSYSLFYSPYFGANAAAGWKIGGGSFSPSTFTLAWPADWAVHTVKLSKRK
jgi:hypothetical protein